MTLGDIIDLTRILLAEPDPDGRWSDSDLTALINRAQKACVVRLNWPEGTLTANTIANQQEYALPEIIKILRVYLNGQPIIPTDIPTLEGVQIELYDQSAQNFIPQWKFQLPSSYPVQSPVGYPYPSGMSYWPGERPQWYMRGGNIGFVPITSSPYLMQIDIVPTPPQLVAPTDYSSLPDVMQEAIAWKVCAFAHKSDGDDEQFNNANTQFEQQLGILQSWKRGLQGSKPQRIFVFPYRALYKGPWHN